VKAEEAAQKTTPIRLLLAQMNEPAMSARITTSSTTVYSPSEIKRNSPARI
jgi:hypothetical protein